jgi:hypothetical protein
MLPEKHKRVDHWTEPLRGQVFILPSVHDCHDHANSCLDMWNDSVDRTARSWLLGMADAWMRLALELEQRR